MHGASGQLDTSNMRDFVQKNSLERVAHEKKTKTIEHEKKAFVRQYSKDEQEIKNILQRLHVEQHIYDVDDIPAAPEPMPTGGGQDETVDDDEDVFVNPYPITILPKFGQAPTRHGHKKNGGEIDTHRCRMARRKSLEYEDIPPLWSGKQHSRSSLTGTSPPTVGRTRKLSSTSDQPEMADIWVGDPEFISSVRRPRKTSSDINHRKLLKRAMSDVWTHPLQSSAESLSRLSVFARKSSTDDVPGESTNTTSKKDRDKCPRSSKSLHDELSGTTSTSPERDRKAIVVKDTHGTNLQDAVDNKKTYDQTSTRSARKSSFKKSNSKTESETKTAVSDTVEQACSDGKENDDVRYGKLESETGSRIRKIGMAEQEVPTIHITDASAEQVSDINNKRKTLKKKNSMPEMKIGSGSGSTIPSDESWTESMPRARHGSLKEKSKAKADVKTRPRNSSFH